MNKKRIATIVGVVLLALVILGAGAFLVWANDVAQPMPEALAAMQSNELVTFEQQNNWLVYYPNSQGNNFPPNVDTGFVLYPGGKVDYRAYAPLARDIATQGYLVVVPQMPLNLAFFNVNAASDIIKTFPQIQHWAVGGHSLGGVAASMYANSNPQQATGLAFYASYPSGNMQTYPGAVTSIYGTNDGLATPEKIQESKKNLPPQTVYVPIEGGNHGQFGWYGAQAGDNPATISREEQQKQTVAATVEMLKSLK